MDLFTDDADVIDIGATYLVIVGSCYFIFSTMLSLNGVMRGAGDTIVPMFITLFSLWLIRIPIAALLSGRISGTFSALGFQIKLPPVLSGQLQEVGIWWSVPLAWLVGSIFSFFYYHTGNWKNKTVVKSQKENE